MTGAENTAITALREAAGALRIGEETAGPEDHVPESGKPDLAIEVAHVLDAMVRLLRTVDLDTVPTSSTGHSLNAVAQHLTAGATLARGTARGASSDSPSGSGHRKLAYPDD